MFTNLTVLFWPRKNRLNAKNETTLWCTISQNRKKAEFSTRIKINLHNWDQKKGQANGVNGKRINLELDILREKILKVRLNHLAKDLECSPIVVKHILQGKKILSPTFFEVFDEFVNRKKEEFKPCSIKKYNTLKNHLKLFFLNKPVSKSEEISFNMLGEFEYYLKKQNIKDSYYLNKMINYVKSVLRFCQSKNIEIDVSALSYNVKKEKQKPIIFLTTENLKAIESFKFPFPYLQRTADLFIFQCYTGFAYIDMQTFDFEKHIEKDGGNTWIVKARQKSEEPSILPLFPRAEEILKNYEFKLPKISNQKYNAYLKIVGEIVGIDPAKMKSHTARRTAGTIWLNSGLSYEVVAKMLGHSKIETTQRHYAKISKKRVWDECKVLFN